MIETTSIKVKGASLAVRECGSGPAVVMVPWARGASDFDELLPALAAAGFRGIALSLRGIEGSTGSYAGGTLSSMAADVAAVIEALGVGPVHLVGHALGNGVVRCTATDHPALVKSVTLIAAGGRVPSPPGALEALSRALAGPLSDTEWLAAMRESGFFARSFDPMRWRHDWWIVAAGDHYRAFNATPREHWWAAGKAPLLIIQGLEDRVAVPENGWDMKKEFGARVKLIDLENAAHALLPEQPEAIARTVIDFLKAQR